MNRFLCALLLALCATAAEKKPVTIQNMPAPPRMPAITWSPDGQRFAWMEERAIWEYEVSSKKKKELVALGALEDKALKPPKPEITDWQNRRVSEQSFQWSSNGREMLISVSGDLFLLHTETGKWEQLTATAEPERDPKLSPDGRYVSFRRDHDLYSLEVLSKKVRQLTTDGSATLWNGELDWVYPEELNLSTAHWWAPDSSAIAYLQFDISREPVFPQVDLLSWRAFEEPERFPQPGTPNAEVRLGVVGAEGGATRWMDLGDTREHLLARVYWSPDSRALAYERLNRVQSRLELGLADSQKGAARVLLTEQDESWINVNDDFRFLNKGRQFLWGSERDGYRHLYLYTIDDRRPVALTRGEWEVTEVAGVSEEKREVFYVSTEQSPLERQLYRVRFDGKMKQRLSGGEGTHAISMSPTTEYYMDTASSLTTPPRRTLNDSDGSQIAVYQEATPPDVELLPAELIKLKAADGTLLYARMIKPAGFSPDKKYPVIVDVYGGPGVQTVRDAWSGANFDQVLAQKGYLIWQLDNRGSSGRGHAWESTIYHRMGQQELRDQLDGIQYLKTLGYADMARVGISGWSYGGYMTLYALAHAPDVFRAGIAGAPVTDWRNYDSIYTERYMGLPEDNEEGYRASSPQTKAGDIKAQLLLLHNIEDDNVHFQNTMQMAQALERDGRQFRMVVYPQKSHGVGGPLRRQLYETMLDFFDRTLK
ncbi:MAG TPA: S9 family peptidase [Bryobacteraceae bacterium]|nr:S9 family peptidase [Bryobacteraceae bacterium]